MREALLMVCLSFIGFYFYSFYGYLAYSEVDFPTGSVGFNLIDNTRLYYGLFGLLLPALLLSLVVAKLLGCLSKPVSLKVYLNAVLLTSLYSIAFISITQFIFEDFTVGIGSVFGGWLLSCADYLSFRSGFVALNLALYLLPVIYIIYIRFNVSKMPEKVSTSVVPSEKKDVKRKVNSEKKVSGSLLPSPLFLKERHEKKQMSKQEIERLQVSVRGALAQFGVQADVKNVEVGNVIIRVSLDVQPGVKVSSVLAIASDLARVLKVASVRVVDTIEGTHYIGLEIPAPHRSVIDLKPILTSPAFVHSNMELPIIVGENIVGDSCIIDLAKSPHLLVAGTTGSGKSVGVNVMIASLLYKFKPSELKFIMIDPKILELSIYQGIPHLISDVITDMKLAFSALTWCVGEMDRRYKLMAEQGVRNIKAFNALDNSAHDFEKLPYIVVVVDEFADLIMVQGKKVEELICRLAQKARAAGIHLIIATQRPSVNVVTGLIKANIPTRIAYMVSSKVDSRTIVEQSGAEQLLGNGDLLLSLSGSPKLIRAHSAFIDEEEIKLIVSSLSSVGSDERIDFSSEDVAVDSLSLDMSEEDSELYERVLAILVDGQTISISKIQRILRIGYNRAARIVEILEDRGVLVLNEKNQKVAKIS